MAFDRLRKIQAWSEDCTVLSLSLSLLTSLVSLTLSTTLFSRFFLLLRTNLDLFFSFSLQSQMCQKKEHFYHCCQKQDANNLPPSNTSVLFTREQHTKGSRSLSTTQCMEVQRPNYLHPMRAGQAVLCFIRTVVLLMEKKKNNLLVLKCLWGHQEPQP